MLDYEQQVYEIYGAKSDLIRSVEAIRDRYEPGQRVDENDELELQMLPLHRGLDEFTRRTFSHFKVASGNGNRVILVVFTDGTSSVLDYMASIEYLYEDL